MRQNDVTLTQGLLGLLTYYSGGSRIMWRYVNGQLSVRRDAKQFVLKNKHVSGASVRTTLYRLQKRGMVEKNGEAWQVTFAGRSFLSGRLKEDRLPIHATRVKSDAKSNKQMIVMFDIPESHKRVRNWLRIELSLLGFEILQKSVWLGPAPIPREFVKKLNDMDILEFIHFFQVTKEDIV